MQENKLINTAVPPGDPASQAQAPRNQDEIAAAALAEAKARAAKTASAIAKPAEVGGPSGPEPTRYGDWERNGRVSDF